MRLNERPKCQRTNTETAVPTSLSKLAMSVWVIERFARGKKVTRVIKKVPAIAITRGKIPFAFLMGSSLTRNKTDCRPKKQRVEDRDSKLATNVRAASLPD